MQAKSLVQNLIRKWGFGNLHQKTNAQFQFCEFSGDGQVYESCSRILLLKPNLSMNFLLLFLFVYFLLFITFLIYLFIYVSFLLAMEIGDQGKANSVKISLIGSKVTMKIIHGCGGSRWATLFFTKKNIKKYLFIYFVP